MTDKEFLAAFEGFSLTPRQWTHEAHVRATWLCIASSDDHKAAMRRIATGVRNLSSFINCVYGSGTVSSYHATITGAYARVIAGRVREGETFIRFLARNPDLVPGPGQDKLAPLMAHYSRGLLLSDSARSRFRAPDLAPLPAPPGAFGDDESGTEDRPPSRALLSPVAV
jgi:hypothetical protein